jgi:hypothetical protein
MHVMTIKGYEHFSDYICYTILVKKGIPTYNCDSFHIAGISAMYFILVVITLKSCQINVFQ